MVEDDVLVMTPCLEPLVAQQSYGLIDNGLYIKYIYIYILYIYVYYYYIYYYIYIIIIYILLYIYIYIYILLYIHYYMDYLPVNGGFSRAMLIYQRIQ